MKNHKICFSFCRKNTRCKKTKVLEYIFVYYGNLSTFHDLFYCLSGGLFIHYFQLIIEFHFHLSKIFYYFSFDSKSKLIFLYFSPFFYIFPHRLERSKVRVTFFQSSQPQQVSPPIGDNQFYFGGDNYFNNNSLIDSFLNPTNDSICNMTTVDGQIR